MASLLRLAVRHSCFKLSNQCSVFGGVDKASRASGVAVRNIYLQKKSVEQSDDNYLLKRALFLRQYDEKISEIRQSLVDSLSNPQAFTFDDFYRMHYLAKSDEDIDLLVNVYKTYSDEIGELKEKYNPNFNFLNMLMYLDKLDTTCELILDNEIAPLIVKDSQWVSNLAIKLLEGKRMSESYALIHDMIDAELKKPSESYAIQNQIHSYLVALMKHNTVEAFFAAKAIYHKLDDKRVTSLDLVALVYLAIQQNEIAFAFNTAKKLDYDMFFIYLNLSILAHCKVGDYNAALNQLQRLLKDTSATKQHVKPIFADTMRCMNETFKSCDNRKLVEAFDQLKSDINEASKVNNVDLPTFADNFLCESKQDDAKEDEQLKLSRQQSKNKSKEMKSNESHSDESKFQQSSKSDRRELKETNRKKESAAEDDKRQSATNPEVRSESRQRKINEEKKADRRYEDQLAAFEKRSGLKKKNFSTVNVAEGPQKANTELRSSNNELQQTLETSQGSFVHINPSDEYQKKRTKIETQYAEQIVAIRNSLTDSLRNINKLKISNFIRMHYLAKSDEDIELLLAHFKAMFKDPGLFNRHKYLRRDFFDLLIHLEKFDKALEIAHDEVSSALHSVIQTISSLFPFLITGGSVCNLVRAVSKSPKFSPKCSQLVDMLLERELKTLDQKGADKPMNFSLHRMVNAYLGGLMHQNTSNAMEKALKIQEKLGPRNLLLPLDKVAIYYLVINQENFKHVNETMRGAFQRRFLFLYLNLSIIAKCKNRSYDAVLSNLEQLLKDKTITTENMNPIFSDTLQHLDNLFESSNKFSSEKFDQLRQIIVNNPNQTLNEIDLATFASEFSWSSKSVLKQTATLSDNTLKPDRQPKEETQPGEQQRIEIKENVISNDTTS